MGFYDSVKDNVRREHDEAPGETAEQTGNGEHASEPQATAGNAAGPEGDGMPFDQLKNNAEQYNDDEADSDADGDDTQIEVLTEDGLQPASNPEQAPRGDAGNTSSGGSPEQQEPQQRSAQSSAATEQQASAGRQVQNGAQNDEVLDALQALQQQNDEILDVLRGIKRTLEQQ